MSTEETSPAAPAPQAAGPGTAEADAKRAGPGGLRVATTGLVLTGVLLLGAGTGAVAMRIMQPRQQQALLPVVPINQMADGNLVAVKGKVAEVFGNKFIVADAGGRALVDTGREGEDRPLVGIGEEITAQGRFDGGFVRAGMVIHADGRVDELRAPGPRHGPGNGPGRHDRGRDPMHDGPRHGPIGPGGPDESPEGGPDAGPDAPPRA